MARIYTMGFFLYAVGMVMVMVWVRPSTASLTPTASTANSSHVCGETVVEEEEVYSTTITYACTIIVEEKCSGILAWITQKKCNVSKPAKCNRTETVITTVNKTVDACCEGWTKDTAGSCIIPFCAGGCGDGGTCLPVDGVPTCVCRDGYQGENCQLSMEMTTVLWSETGAKVMEPHWTNLRVGLTVALTLAALLTVILVIVYISCLIRRRQSRLRMDTLGLIDRQRNIYVTSDEMKRPSDAFNNQRNSLPHVVYAVSAPLDGTHTNLAFAYDDVIHNRHSIISEGIYTEVDEGSRGVVTESHDAEGYLQARSSIQSTPSINSRPSRTSSASVTSGATESTNSVRSQIASYMYISEESDNEEGGDAENRRISNTSRISGQSSTLETESIYMNSTDVPNHYAEPADNVSNYAVIPEDGEECRDEVEHLEDAESDTDAEHDYHYIPSRMTPDSIVACSASESEPLEVDLDHPYDYIPHINLSDSDRPHLSGVLSEHRGSHPSSDSNTHALTPEMWDSDSDIESITDSIEDDYDYVSPRGKHNNIADCTLSDISDLDDFDGSADNSYDFIPSSREGLPSFSTGSDSVFGQISGELEHDYEIIPERKLTYLVSTPPDAQSTPVRARRDDGDPIYANLPDLLVGAASMDSMPFDSLEENGLKLSGDIIDVLKSAPISRQDSLNGAHVDLDLPARDMSGKGRITRNLPSAVDSNPLSEMKGVSSEQNSEPGREGYSATMSVLNDYCDDGDESLYEIMNVVGDTMTPDSLDCIDDIPSFEQSSNAGEPAVADSPVCEKNVKTSTAPLITQSSPTRTNATAPSGYSSQPVSCRDARWRFNDSLDGDTSFSTTDDDSDYEQVCPKEELSERADNNRERSHFDLPPVHSKPFRVSSMDEHKHSQMDEGRVHFGELGFDKLDQKNVDSEA